jgi:transposase-like protein
VVLDACRDNPFLGRTRAIQAAGGLAEMRAYGTLIAYASAPGATAEDGPPGTNSIYSRHLATEMLSEGVQIEEMFRNVRVKVYRDTAERQIPWDHSSLTVKVVLNPSRNAGAGEAISLEAQRRMDDTMKKLEAQRAQLEEERRQLDEEKRRWAGERQQTVAVAKPAPVPAPTAAEAQRASELLRKENELKDREQALKRIDQEVRREPPPASAAPPAAVAAPAMQARPPSPPISPNAAPVAPASPVAVAASPPTTLALPASPAARAGLCAELVMRFQVGLPLSAEEMKFLQQKECKK